MADPAATGLAAVREVVLPAALRRDLLRTALDRYPGKLFGFLLSPGRLTHPTDFVAFRDNIRNDAGWRDEFERRGQYFVEHPDAGFVATAEESWQVQRDLVGRGLREVAVFHTHRRHPGAFSDVDYELHVSRSPALWHLIISLRNPAMPQLRAFGADHAGVREFRVRCAA